jgi:dolichol-phosphate mannosyltransferase
MARIYYMDVSMTKKLSVVMPVYNESGTVLEVIRQIKAVPLSVDLEIIIVDDGSHDGTNTLLQNLDDQDIKVILHKTNRGKGMAIRTALAHATGDIIIIQDADLEYDPQDYIQLLKPILQDEASVVYGNRRGKQKMEKSYARYYWGGRLITIITNLLYRAHIHDEPVCYKVFKKEVLEEIELNCEKFEFCPEVTAKVCKAGHVIHEVPVSYNPRGFQQGKKINWQDGIQAIWTLVKYRFCK